jgi:hypothetical protein
MAWPKRNASMFDHGWCPESLVEAARAGEYIFPPLIVISRLRRRVLFWRFEVPVAYWPVKIATAVQEAPTILSIIPRHTSSRSDSRSCVIYQIPQTNVGLVDF